MSTRSASRPADWPDLPLAAWDATRVTLHLWTQIVGKIRLARAPSINHWWQVPLYVTSRGLTTSPIPYGARAFQIDFDFLAHALEISVDDGRSDRFALVPRTVADFYAELLGRMRALGLEVAIWTVPCEIEQPIRFEADDRHAAYDADFAHRFWRVLVQSDRVFTSFRAGYLGKVSPVHFFWGSFDLAVTRFSGRRAPPHPGAPNVADRVTREAYSHEVSSAGFWPGGPGLAEPVFYAYAYPQPAGFAAAAVAPAAAAYSTAFGEFLLPYAAVRAAAAPDEILLQFLESTYAAAADLGHWDRAALERAPIDNR
ncbi:MAG TPA: DUF5996 family protein [Stellaceae bacterium]|nr:DUF5996 family protein [Stellaceae bacterium]